MVRSTWEPATRRAQRGIAKGPPRELSAFEGALMMGRAPEIIGHRPPVSGTPSLHGLSRSTRQPVSEAVHP